MKKKDLVSALEPLDDDAIVYGFVTHLENDGGAYAQDIYFDDIVSGKSLQNEITIVMRID